MLNYNTLIYSPNKPEEQVDPKDLSWLRWIITAIAIVGSYATGGLSLKAAIAVNTAISVAETAAQLGIDISQDDEINPLGLGIEVLATILPIPISIRSAKRSIGTLRKATLKYETLSNYKWRNEFDLKWKDLLRKNPKRTFNNRPFHRLGFSSKDINWNMPMKVVKDYQQELNKAFNNPAAKRILRKFNNRNIKEMVWNEAGLTGKERFILASGIGSLIKRKRATEQNFRGVIKSLSPKARRILTKNFERNFEPHRIHRSSPALKTTGKSYLRYLGSKRFNDKIVQRAQWIDAVDAGRAPIEFIYKKLVRYWNYVLKIGFKKTYELALKNSKRALTAEKAWRSYRKIDLKRPVFFSSRYLHNMRVLRGWNNLAKDPMVCIMNFVRYTYKRGKNADGKIPVIFLATKKEYRRLANEGSVYWWKHQNKYKGWWYSRGGKRSHNFKIGLESQYIGFLVSILPFQAIKFVSSILSNWLEAFYEITGGEWSINNWIDEFQRSFKRMAIKRTGRFLGKDVIGRSIAKQLPNPFHKEIARRTAWGVGTTITETFEASLKRFKKRPAYTSKELGNIFVKVAKRQVQSKTVTLGRSKTRRLTGQSLNPYLLKKTTRRKAHILRATRSTLIKGRAKTYKIKL